MIVDLLMAAGGLLFIYWQMKQMNYPQPRREIVFAMFVASISIFLFNGHHQTAFIALGLLVALVSFGRLFLKGGEFPEKK